MGALVVVASVTGAVLFGIAFGRDAVRLAAMVSAVTAVLLGWPMVFWLLDQGRITARAWAVAGLVLGGLPLVLAALSGVGGMYIRQGDADLVMRVLQDGAPIPWFGVIAWPRFVRYELAAIVAGLVTSAGHWRLFIQR
jgi:hypothetical protein